MRDIVAESGGSVAELPLRRVFAHGAYVNYLATLILCSLSIASFEAVADDAGKPSSRASAEVTRQFNVRIPMRDGVMLSADIHRPSTSERVPVVLIRTPYTKSVQRYAEEGQWWAEHGYAFVVQDTRGRGDSDGTFYPMINEAKDGFDTLAWVGSQAWSNGRVGMTGISYLGVTQVFAASELSPFLKAIIPGFTPADPNRYWPTHSGVALLRTADWLAGLDGHVNQDRSSLDLEKAFRATPLVELDARLGRNLPAWRDWATHPPGDEYWKAQSYQEKLLEAKLPILHVTGWYDTVPFGNTDNFINMSHRASDPATRQQQQLLIGPWGHGMTANRKHGAVDFGTASMIDFRGVQLRWFDRWLKEIDNGVDREPRVRVFAMGANRWIEENEWPIARTTYVKYYLRSKGRANSRLGDGQLSRSPPATEPPDRFRYDPDDPVPFMSPAHNPEWPEPEDFREVETRADVLVYSSEPVTEPTLVCGPLRVKLFAASSARDTDWTARVLDVWPDGFAQQLSYGIVRARFRNRDKEELIEPGKAYEYDIDVWSTCVELQKGHRARLEISSSAFPWFDRNLNTGGQFGLETRGVVAQQTVLHNRQYASYLLLPIVPRASLPEQTNVLPRPPAVRLATIPRAPGDKPQETYVAVNPRDPRQVVVSYHQAVEEGSDHHPGVRVDLHVASSADEGNSWTLARTTNENYLKSLDAAVTFDLHGHAFLVHLALDKIGYVTRHGEFVRRSLDGGKTWDASPITLIERPERDAVLDHMPKIVADTHSASPYAGNVYAVWDRSLGNLFKGDKLAAETVVTRSTDDGKTWSSPRAINRHEASVSHTMAVAHDGTVYLLYARALGFDVETLISISGDGGQTFEAPRPVMRAKDAYRPATNFARAPGGPVIAIDPRAGGKLFVVWGDHRNGDRDILAIASDDGGRTWTAPVRVNDDPLSNGKDQTMEWPAVDPTDGTLYVIFYDRRGDPRNLKPTVTLARSTDGGRIFVNYAWGDRTLDPQQAGLGDYIGMAAQDGRVYGAWVENIAEPRKKSGKEPRKAGPGEMEMEDGKWPSGPSAIRVGIADFRSAR